METTNTRILSTKLLRKESLAEATASGLHIDQLSFIETATIKSKDLSRHINAIADRYASIIFTSAKAVEAVMDIVGYKETQWRVYCTEPQTRKILLQYFTEERIAGSAPDATQLSGIIISDQPANPLVFFCSDHARDELPALLEKENITIEKVVVYKTILQPKNVEEAYDGILFFSPTAVESFFTTNSPSLQTVFFAIGETTAAALRKATTNEIIVSDHSSEEWMIKKIQERFLVKE